MEKTLTNGMVEALDQATLNQVREQIMNLSKQGYRVPDIAKVGPKEEGLITGLFSGNALKLPKTLSVNKEKRLKRLAFRFLQRPTWANANVYLHFLYKKVLCQEAPRVRLPEKEEKILQARKAWKRAQAESDKLLAAYKEEKGGYFKEKSLSKQAA